MKNLFTKHVLPFGIALILISGCNSSTKTKADKGITSSGQEASVEVEVFDGKHHTVDSKEIAFVNAGRKAFAAAVKEAGPIILEPIVDVLITIPSQAMGDVSGDMASHRGVITDTQIDGKSKTLLRCKAPLSEMGDYSYRLKSLASGDGSFTMELSHFDPVPMQTQQQLCKGYEVKEMA